MKKILGIHSAPDPHWVGDGFLVRSLFSYHDNSEQLSPFLLLDYAEPLNFKPGLRPRGVGEHPHRGFETVTIVYKGEVTHRDSTGAGGTIRPGDVQWMTAASGILHDEFHSQEFTQTGGDMEMVQLWVNLPAADKLSKPTYQTLLSADFPVVELAGDAGSLRVIAGNYKGHTGSARTFTPLDVWDIRLKQGREADFELIDGRTALIVVLHGDVIVNGSAPVSRANLVMLERAGSRVTLKADTDAMLLILSGEPIDEPVVGYGPFVMNSPTEIQQAIMDFRSGRYGELD